MNCVSRLSRFVLFSPGFLLLFLIIPLAVVLNLVLKLGVPLVDFRLMLVNNLCFAAIVACRLALYLSRARKEIRYGAGGRPLEEGCRFPVSADGARGVFTKAGYAFDPGGGYGEKRDFGYLGTVIFYAGLLLLLAVGCWDNLHQFSGVLLDGIGPATKLSRGESYRSISKGILSHKLDSLPELRILSQILPDSTYPKGATEVALLPEKGEPVTTLLLPGVPLRYGPYDVYMSKLVYMPEIVVRGKDGVLLFDDLVQLDPLVKKRGDFAFYGVFQGGIVGGGIYYNPEKSQMMMVVSRNNQRVVADLTFQVDQQVTAGEYTLSCAKLGQWTEIHVVHRRHKELLMIGGIIALLGLAIRIAIKPQRVWLEEAEGGCSVTAVGGESRKLLQAE
jgi:hypothetical protein